MRCFDEVHALTAENIEAVRARTGELPVWRLIEANWGRIRAAIDGARRTLTYNDFYYTNLAVARDGSSALMFDYGLLGKGYASTSYPGVVKLATSMGTSTTLVMTQSAVQDALNRPTSVDAANTSYTTYMARGEALFSAETDPTVNGTIAWQYE